MKLQEGTGLSCEEVQTGDRRGCVGAAAGNRIAGKWVEPQNLVRSGIGSLVGLNHKELLEQVGLNHRLLLDW